MDDKTLQTGKYTNIVKAAFNVMMILLPASFPFNLQVSSILTVLVAVCWVLLGFYKNIPATFQNKYFVMFVLLFFIPFLSLFYSENKDFSLVEKRVFLFVYPLMIFTSRLRLETVKIILYSFAMSCTVAAIYALILTVDRGEVLGTEMTKQHIGITHVYFGWYLTFCIMTLGYFLVNRKKHNYVSILLGIQILFLLFFLFALGSKMSIISLFILTGAICIRFIVKTKRWKLGAAVLMIPVCIFLVTIKNFEVVYYRFYDLFNPENYFVGDNAWNSIGVRLSVLKCVSQTVIQSPFFGTGIGDVQNDLDICYNNLELTTVVGMNAHNQYLQFVMGTGVISLFIFLAAFFLPILNNSKAKTNPLCLFFFILFLLCSLTESLLERQHGTMFFAFFSSLLFVNTIKKSDIQEILKWRSILEG